MSENFIDYFKRNPEELAAYEEKLALGRFADPVNDVGKLSVFLAGPDCFLTGQTFFCDGGQVMLP
jgi:hypothetical protein